MSYSRIQTTESNQSRLEKLIEAMSSPTPSTATADPPSASPSAAGPPPEKKKPQPPSHSLLETVTANHLVTFVDGFAYEDQEGAASEVRSILQRICCGPGKDDSEHVLDCSSWASELRGAIIWYRFSGASFGNPSSDSAFMISPAGRVIDWSRIRDRKARLPISGDHYQDAVLHTFRATRLSPKWVRNTMMRM